MSTPATFLRSECNHRVYHICVNIFVVTILPEIWEKTWHGPGCEVLWD